MILKIRVCSLVMCLTVATLGFAQTDDAWSVDYKRIEQSIRQPEFAEHTYLVTDNGVSARNDAAKNQKAINRLIERCSRLGGGRVVIPAGEWHTGAIRLQSGVNLVIAKGAKVCFSTDTSLYPLVLTAWEGLDMYNYSPLIYAYQAKDVAVTGEGVIDGCASREAWWPMWGAAKYGWTQDTPEAQSYGSRNALLKMSDDGVPVEQRIFGTGKGMRPQMIQLYECDGVLLEGVTILNSPFWVIHPLKSRNVTLRGLTIENAGPNGDGCDPESCDGVLIERCYFNTGDDCIAIKSGRNADGRRRNMPSQNIIVRDCRMANGHGGVVIGSEMSGGARNIFIENCEMDSPNLDRVIRLKTNTCRGGVAENIYVRNIWVGQCKEAVLKINLVYEPSEQSQRGFYPVVRNVYMENVNCESSRYGAFIDGLPDSLNVYGIHVKDCRWNGVKENGNLLRGLMKDVKFDNVTINGRIIQ